MGRIYVPTTGYEDWSRFVADPKHWRAGYSAMAAARSWEAARGLPTEIGAILGADAELLMAVPEHKVDVPGRGRQSQCDVFALVRTGEGLCTLAVEAKVNETFGPTIGEWTTGASDNKVERLTAITRMLGLGPSPDPSLRYQLFHRTAAAIVEAERFGASTAAMIVQSFSRDHCWFDDFVAFCQALGTEAARSRAIRHELPDGRPLILGWATGSPEFLGEQAALAGD